MFADAPFTKDNLNTCLKELAKEFRKLNGTAMSAEIILIGGAAILAGYGFREMTYDIDAAIYASSVMKEAADRVGDRLGLPNGWLNTDFRNTKSYSEKLPEVSVYYKTFSNILTVRIIAAEYLIAMKLMSGRKYKNDLSDIMGILYEHKKNQSPITKEMIDKAVSILYGGWEDIPESSKHLLDAAFDVGDYQSLYENTVENERQAKEILVDFDKSYPGKLKSDNIDSVLEQARRKQAKNKKP
jgi:hypothetical protein